MARRFFNQFMHRIKHEARHRPGDVTISESSGKKRTFEAYDWGCDTFVFETRLASIDDNARLPVSVVRKSVLLRGAQGFVFIATCGNHSVALVPLLSGMLWNLGQVAPKNRSAIIRDRVVMGNVNGKAIDIYQRDTFASAIIEADEWFRGVGLGLDRVFFVERTAEILEHYRKLGQEWRIRTQTRTRSGMEEFCRSSHRSIDTAATYYYSVKGVHFLTYAEFMRITAMAEKDPAAVTAILREWVALANGSRFSNMRLLKYQGHKEIDFFGLKTGRAESLIVPGLERLLEGITIGRSLPGDVFVTLTGIGTIFLQALERPDYADETSDAFIVDLYNHLTGTIYLDGTDSALPHFDDRRVALPGATYRGGKAEPHPSADARSLSILGQLEHMLNFNESMEHVNIYEIRPSEDVPVGQGNTREIVYKTNRAPLVSSLIEKRFASSLPGYGSYMLTRVNAFRALGASYCSYQLLTRLGETTRAETHFFLREWCPGDSLDFISPSCFVTSESDSDQAEDAEILEKLVFLYGEAAAQNLIAKKYVEAEKSNRYGIGKEIFEFAFDPRRMKEVPVAVRICSIRGIMGWPDFSHTDENIQAVYRFYLRNFAAKLCDLWRKHSATSPLNTLANAYFEGFAAKTTEMHWNYRLRQESFDSFDPHLRQTFDFKARWNFALWALCRQMVDLPALREQFMDYVRDCLLAASHQDKKWK